MDRRFLHHPEGHDPTPLRTTRPFRSITRQNLSEVSLPVEEPLVVMISDEFRQAADVALKLFGKTHKSSNKGIQQAPTGHRPKMIDRMLVLVNQDWQML